MILAPFEGDGHQDTYLHRHGSPIPAYLRMYSGPRRPSCALTAIQKLRSISVVEKTPNMRMTGKGVLLSMELIGICRKGTYIETQASSLSGRQSRCDRANVRIFRLQLHRLELRGGGPSAWRDWKMKTFPWPIVYPKRVLSLGQDSPYLSGQYRINLPDGSFDS